MGQVYPTGTGGRQPRASVAGAKRSRIRPAGHFHAQQIRCSRREGLAVISARIEISIDKFETSADRGGYALAGRNSRKPKRCYPTPLRRRH